MDKYEFNVKVEQIKKLVSKGDYETAMKIADTIDWRRVRNISLLSMVATIYEKNGEYQEAKDILLLAFERAPIGKRLLYKLAELAVKQGNVEESEDYYREFCDLAPDDPRQYLLRYMILGAKGAPAEQLIHTLEQYCNVELDEKWMYELAALYNQAGMSDLCVRTCDKIMLMFGLGKYVDKAMELKLQHAPLTQYQMDLEENRDKYEARLREVEQEYEAVPAPAYDGGLDEDLESGGPGRPERAERIRQIQHQDEDTPVYGERQPYRFYSRPQEVPEEPQREQEDSQASESAAAYREEELQPQEEPAAGPKPPAVEKEEPKEAASEPETAEESQDGESGDWEVKQAPMTEEALAARVHEAEVQANLARELSRISGAEFSEESRYAQTRVLKDIRSLKVRGEDVDVMAEPSKRMSNNLMIEAEDPEEGLVIAVDALKKIHREFGITNQAAKITGEKLNKRGVLALADKLVGKDLIIEYAGDMRDDILEELDQLMARDETGMNVVLIDNQEQLEAIHQYYPGLAKRFECIGESVSGRSKAEPEEEPFAAEPEEAYEEEETAVQAKPQKEALREPVKETLHSAKEEPEDSEPYGEEEPYDEEEPYEEEPYEEEPYAEPETPYEEILPRRSQPQGGEEHEEELEDDGHEMDIDEFAQYAAKYAGEIDCSISGKSMLALYERIEIMEEDGIPLTKANAEDLIEEAADRAERPSLGKRMKGIFSSKYDKEGRLILKEEHFI